MNYDQYRLLLKSIKPMHPEPTFLGLSYRNFILVAPAAVAATVVVLYQL